jgi:hypothetical protein
MRFSSLVVTLPLGALLALPAVAEDLTIAYKLTGHGAATTATQYYSASKIRTSTGDVDSVFDLAAGRILNIDNKKKEYSEITLAELEAAMQQAQAQMEEAMKNVPPQMREMMQQKMGAAAGGVASSITVTKGGTRTVAGYPCQEYTIAFGGMSKNDTCNTTSLQIPFDPAQFRKMSAFINPAMAKNASKLADQLQEVKGIPLSETTTVSVLGRTTTSSKEATEVKKGAIPASMFDAPADYKKVESPMKQMLQGRPGKKQ